MAGGDATRGAVNNRIAELPESADLDELLAQLNEIGRKSGLEISTVEPTPGGPVPDPLLSKPGQATFITTNAMVRAG